LTRRSAPLSFAAKRPVHPPLTLADGNRPRIWNYTQAQFASLPEYEQDNLWSRLAEDHRRADELDARHDAYMEGVAAPPVRRTPQRPARPVTLPGAHLPDIPTETYVAALTGTEVRPGRRACCPFPDHDDSSGDFAAYHTNSFNCFGCNRGGNIFTFAAILWGYGLPLHGDRFIEVRDRLVDEFGT
jgi:CHC2 zinc finger